MVFPKILWEEFKQESYLRYPTVERMRKGIREAGFDLGVFFDSDRRSLQFRAFNSRLDCTIGVASDSEESAVRRIYNCMIAHRFIVDSR